ncbi:MAG: hypothetical protein ACJAWL_002119 [Motiliproteus sp.]|jgi:hypothetical protein
MAQIKARTAEDGTTGFPITVATENYTPTTLRLMDLCGVKCQADLYGGGLWTRQRESQIEPQGPL